MYTHRYTQTVLKKNTLPLDKLKYWTDYDSVIHTGLLGLNDLRKRGGWSSLIYMAAFKPSRD